MSNIQKALDLIGTFATGNAELAASLLDEGYIQHNTGIADGLSNEPRQRSLDARASSAALARGVGGSAVAGSDWKPTLSISSGMRRHSKNA